MSNIETRDIELGTNGFKQVPQVGNALVSNPTYDYFQKEDKLSGFLSQQFPTTANPAPLGLSAFALTTLVLSLYNAGGLTCKSYLSFWKVESNLLFHYLYSDLCSNRSGDGFGSLLRRLVSITSRDVGIQDWKYIWSFGIFILRRILDELFCAVQ